MTDRKFFAAYGAIVAAAALSMAAFEAAALPVLLVACIAVVAMYGLGHERG